MAKRVAGERSQSQAVAYVVVLVFALCFVGVLLVNSVSWTPAKLWPWSPPTLCRNTQQGPERVADQNGYVCTRNDLVNGCCAEEAEQSVRFSCRSCNSTHHCCEEYEECVSCCMDPERRSIVMKTLLESRNPVYHTAKDSFDFCRARCRTSSSSVVHHKHYRSNEKHCFGPSPAPLSASTRFTLQSLQSAAPLADEWDVENADGARGVALEGREKRGASMPPQARVLTSGNGGEEAFVDIAHQTTSSFDGEIVSELVSVVEDVGSHRPIVAAFSAPYPVSSGSAMLPMSGELLFGIMLLFGVVLQLFFS